MSTDLRALCAELVGALERLHKQSVTAPRTQFVELSNGRHAIPLGNDVLVQDLMVNHLLDLARAALAVEVKPPTDDELYELMDDHTFITGLGERLDRIAFARAVLARYGNR